MDLKLQISSSPHILTKRTTRNIMLDVVISLLPATAAGIVWFGLSAVWVILACVVTAGVSEYFFNRIVNKKQSVADCSAIVTGLLLALNLPANVPIWQAVIGAFFAIIVVKCLFGGLGRNIVNPAITARVFMLVSFGSMGKAAFPVDSVSTATPLAEMAEGKAAPALMDLFIGNHGGAIGETCVLALLIGAVYLFARGIISWHIPVSFIGTVFFFTWAVVGDPAVALAYCLAGGLFIGAIFMATDYVTAPETGWGKLIFGVGCGIITVLIRFWGDYPEGVSFAILLMNILNPFIDSWTARKPFGGDRK